MKKIIIIIILLFIPSMLWAKHLHQERDYQHDWCHGQTEVVLSDRTRCDCIQDGYAIEVDFAEKWAESMTQSLHYALMTGLRPGIVLIVEQPKDEHFVDMLRDVVDKYKLNIKIWVIRLDSVGQDK